MNLLCACVLVAALAGCGEVKDLPPDAPEPGVAVASLVRVRQGESVFVDVAVTRDRFEGPIEVSITGLPSGVTAAPLEIGPASNTGSVRVQATTTAAQVGPLAVKLVAALGEPVEVPLRLYVAGAAGAFDTSFSSDGITTLDSATPNSVDDARDVIIDRSGRIVATGVVQDIQPNQGVMYRLTAEGVNDVTFGTAGRIKPAIESVEGVVERPDGGYFALTYTNGTKLQRLDDAGAPVGALVPSSTTSSGYSILGLTDGFVVSGGAVFEKYTYDGAPAAEFGTGGKVSFAAHVGPAVDSRGRIVAAAGFRVGRLLASGEPDSSFSVTFPLPAGMEGATARAIALDAEDGGYLCGSMRPAGGTLEDQLPVLLRFRGDGTINAAFGTDGLLQLLGATSGTCSDIVRLPDGRLLISGSRSLGGFMFQSELWLCNADGSFDTSFGTAGVVLAPNNRLDAVAIDEGVRAILVGAQTGSRLYVARIWL